MDRFVICWFLLTVQMKNVPTLNGADFGTAYSVASLLEDSRTLVCPPINKIHLLQNKFLSK